MDSTDYVVTYQVKFEELRKGTFEQCMMGTYEPSAVPMGDVTG